MPFLGERDIELGSDDLNVPILSDGDIIVQEPTIDAQIDEFSVDATQVEIEKSWFSKAGRMEVTFISDQDWFVSTGREMTVWINGVEAFTGDIREASDNNDGSWTVVVFDAVKDFLNKKVTQTFNDAQVSDIVGRVIESAGLDVEYDVGTQIRKVGSITFEDMAIADILNQVARWFNAVWWVDRSNVLQVKKPQVTVHNLSPDFVEEDPEIGVKSPAYNKVVVRGGGSASSAGVTAAHQIPKYPITAVAGEGTPVYRYSSQQIVTAGEAQAVANAILNKFKRQATKGAVRIIGVGTSITSFDAITMPNGEQYSVNSIVQKFNSEGMDVEITPGRLLLDNGE